MQLIDAHTHLRTGKLSRSPQPASAERALELLLEDMERAEITTSLVVTWPEDVPVLVKETARSPGRLYSLLWFNSRQSERSLEELRLLADSFPLVLVGVKTVFPYLYQSPLQREFFPLPAKLMFGSDRIGQEDKFFRRVQAIKRIPSPYHDDLCHRTATRLYRLGARPEAR